MEEENKKGGKPNPADDDELDLEDVNDDEEDIEDEDLEDDEEEIEDDDDEVKKAKEEEERKKKAELEERSRQAKARREREAKEQAEKEKRLKDSAYLKGKLEATKVNTFTNEPIEDEYDLKVYELQKQIEKDGGDPIADLPKRLATLDREQGNNRKKDEDAKKESEELIKNDIRDFREKNPKVNLKELLNDPDFMNYYDGRLGIKGGKSLDTLYKEFNSMKSKYSKRVKENDEEDDDNPTPPSPNGGRKQKQTSYSSMSEEDRIKELKRQGLI